MTRLLFDFVLQIPVSWFVNHLWIVLISRLKCRKMSLESVEEVETAPSGSFTEEIPEDPESSQNGAAENPDCELSANALAKPRRKSLSKLKRRLSRTFRLSFSGSLSDFAHTFTIDERSEYTDQNGVSGSSASSGSESKAKSLDAEDILPSKFNGKTNSGTFKNITKSRLQIKLCLKIF